MKQYQYLIMAVLGVCLIAASSVYGGEAKCSDEYGSIFPCPDGIIPDDKKAVFMDNGDGTITDLRNNMLWERGDDQTPRTWMEAMAYCEELELGGKSDWSLPTNDDLQTITEFGRSQNVMNEIFKYRQGNYWTATPHSTGLDQYLTIGFFDADSNAHQKETPHFVRCVYLGI